MPYLGISFKTMKSQITVAMKYKKANRNSLSYFNGFSNLC